MATKPTRYQAQIALAFAEKVASLRKDLQRDLLAAGRDQQGDLGLLRSAVDALQDAERNLDTFALGQGPV